MTLPDAVGDAPERVSDLTLERYALRELSDDEVRVIEERLSRDETVRTRFRALEVADEAIGREYGASALARDVMRRVNAPHVKPRQPLGRVLGWSVAAAAAVLAIVAIQPPHWLHSDGASRGAASSGETQKGEPAQLIVYRHTPAGSEILSDNDVAHAGDLIRVGYRAAEPGYGAIISIDGAGVVTVHMPPQGTASRRLAAGERVLLDDAFELDDAPDVERFYLITAAEPFSLQPVVDQLRAMRSSHPVSRLSPSLRVTTLSLRKEARP